MKFGALKSVGHNIADSLASGIGLMIGVNKVDVFREASAGQDGFIQVDFLTRKTTGLARELPSFCEKHQIDVEQIASLTSRYSVDRVYGPNFLVTVADTRGRISVDQYVGLPGKRIGPGKAGPKPSG